MAKDQVTRYIMTGDSQDLEKALENTARKMNNTGASAKAVKKDVAGMGQAFSQSANQVAIFSGPLDAVAGRLSAIGSGISRFGAASVAFTGSIGAMLLATGRAVEGLDNYEERQLRFNSLLEITGNRSGATAEQLDRLAKSFGERTLSSTAEGAKGINLLLSTTDVSVDKFETLLDTAQGVSQVMGRGFIPTLRTLSKALADPARNATTLATALGVEFTPEMQKSITTLVEMGDKAQATDRIINLLGDTFSKFASGEAGGKAGQLDSLGEAWDKFWESVGRTDTITSLNSVIRSAITSSTDLLNELEGIHNPAPQQRTNNLSKEYKEITDGWLNSVTTKMPVWLSYAVESNLVLGKLVNTSLDLRRVQSELLVDSTTQSANRVKALKAEEQQKKQALQNELASAEIRINALRKIADEEKRTSQIASETQVEKVTRQSAERIETLKNNLKERLDAEKEASLARGKLQEDETMALAGFLDVKARLEDEFTQLVTAEVKARDRKIANIEEVERKKRIAEAQRDFRQLQNVNLAIAGEDELKRIKANYDTQVFEFENMTFAKTTLAALGYTDQEKLRADLLEKLKASYKIEVAEFKDKEQKKLDAEKARLDRQQELSDRENRRKFDQDVKSQVTSAPTSFAEDFFNVEFTTTQEKLDELLRIRQEHEARITQTVKDGVEARRQIEALSAQFTIQEAQVTGDGQKKAASDTWDALGTLASSGSKKAFAIMKAGRIAMALVNTYTAATNALATVPFPFNIAAASLIGAAGFAQVRAIRAEKPPQFHDGISTVPRTGTYELEGGERVMDNRLNGDLKAHMKRQDEMMKTGGNGGGDINFNVEAADVTGFDRWYQQNRDKVMRDYDYHRRSNR